jgi:hypothetical protein
MIISGALLHCFVLADAVGADDEVGAAVEPAEDLPEPELPQPDRRTKLNASKTSTFNLDLKLII